MLAISVTVGPVYLFVANEKLRFSEVKSASYTCPPPQGDYYVLQHSTVKKERVLQPVWALILFLPLTRYMYDSR